MKQVCWELRQNGWKIKERARKAWAEGKISTSVVAERLGMDLVDTRALMSREDWQFTEQEQYRQVMEFRAAMKREATK